MRVVIADDSGLIREGMRRLLVEAGMDVVATAVDAPALLDAVREHAPDVAVVDVRMPPTFTHEGAEAAVYLRRAYPRLGILLVSQSIESRYAIDLARLSPARFGYLLKDRVIDVATLIDAVSRVAAGGTVLDPEVVGEFLGRSEARDRLGTLTPREREVLALMAEGRSNQAIARALVLSPRTVEAFVAAILSKLELPPEPEYHRRVLAVVTWLQQRSGVGL